MQITPKTEGGNDLSQLKRDLLDFRYLRARLSQRVNQNPIDFFHHGTRSDITVRLSSVTILKANEYQKASANPQHRLHYSLCRAANQDDSSVAMVTFQNAASNEP